MQGDPWRVSMSFGQQLLVKVEDSNARFRQITNLFEADPASSNWCVRILQIVEMKFFELSLHPLGPFLWTFCPKRIRHIFTCFDLSPGWKNIVRKHICQCYWSRYYPFSDFSVRLGKCHRVWSNSAPQEQLRVLEFSRPPRWVFPMLLFPPGFATLLPVSATFPYISPSIYSSLKITYILTFSSLDFIWFRDLPPIHVRMQKCDFAPFPRHFFPVLQHHYHHFWLFFHRFFHMNLI